MPTQFGELSFHSPSPGMRASIGRCPPNLALRIDRTQAGQTCPAVVSALPRQGFPEHLAALLEPKPALADSDRTTMAYIPYVPYEDAEGLPGELHGQYREGARGVDNILRIHSLNPRSMWDHVRLYVHLMRGPSPLTKIQREMVAVTVSAVNHCFY